MRVLVAVDDPATLRRHVATLRRRGLAADGARTVRAASRQLAAVAYDALVVGRRLGEADGMALAGRVADGTAVVAIAAGATAEERIALLRAGVDDCLDPTVGGDELQLRLCKAIVRRTGGPARVQLGRVLVDRVRREVTVGGNRIPLSALQLGVLDHLIAHRHRVVTPEELREHCWDERTDMFSNPVPSQITRLRRTLAGAVDIAWTSGTGYLVEIVDPVPSASEDDGGAWVG